MATTIILNDGILDVAFKGSAVNDVYFNATHVWPSTPSVAEQNRQRILASGYGVTIVSPTTSSTSSQYIKYADMLAKSEFSTDYTYVLCYWSSDYSHLVVAHDDSDTYIYTIDEALSADMNMKTDKYTSVLTVPECTSEEIDSCTKPVNIYVDAVFFASYTLSQLRSADRINVGSDYYIKSSCDKDNHNTFTIGLYDSATDDLLSYRLMSAGYLVHGENNDGTEVMSVIVDLPYSVPE